MITGIYKLSWFVPLPFLSFCAISTGLVCGFVRMGKKSKAIAAIHPEVEGLASELSDTELEFARLVLSGETLTQAYEGTHRRAKKSTASAAGCKMARIPKVAAYIRASREAVWNEQLLCLAETRSELAKIVRDPKAAHRDKIAAAALDARLGGYERQIEGPSDDEEDRKAVDALARRILSTLDLPSSSQHRIRNPPLAEEP